MGIPVLQQTRRKITVKWRGAMQYPRIFATPDGESRFEDIGVPLEATQLVPGRPAVEVGPEIATSAATLLHLGADWEATWHPTPKHWFCVTLAGELECTTSDGEMRRFGPGSIYFLERRLPTRATRPLLPDSQRR
jgi:hypothetical protein